jgi:hypothetical protein
MPTWWRSACEPETASSPRPDDRVSERLESWVVIRLAATSLWLPERDAEELAVHVTHARVVEPTETAWEPEALVPADDWHGIQGRGEPWLSDAEFRTSHDVALVKLLADEAPPQPDLLLARLGTVDRAIGVIQDVPGMATQTMRGPGGRRMGLHLDNWDRLPAGRRHTSRNRASLNLGPEPRWFLFADLDVVAAHPPDEVPSTETARRLVRDLPTPPTVVRLQVPPGWAYVAPTENLLHDVRSLGQHEGTSHVSALGRFAPVDHHTDHTAIAVDADLPAHPGAVGAP